MKPNKVLCHMFLLSCLVFTVQCTKHIRRLRLSEHQQKCVGCAIHAQWMSPKQKIVPFLKDPQRSLTGFIAIPLY